jgi:hypothetical protein
VYIFNPNDQKICLANYKAAIFRQTASSSEAAFTLTEDYSTPQKNYKN